MRVTMLDAFRRITFGAVILLIAVFSGSPWVASPKPQRPRVVLVPETVREDFEHDSLGQFASYPPPQDVGYEPSLAPTSRNQGEGGAGRALMRVQKPAGNGPLRLGFIRQTFLISDINSKLAFAYRLNHSDANDVIEIGIAGNDGCRYLKRIPAITRAWTHVEVGLSDFRCGTEALGAGVGLEAIYVLADITRADVDVTYRLLIDDISLTASRPARFTVEQPQSAIIESHSAIVSKSGFTKTIPLRITTPARLRSAAATFMAQDGRVAGSQALFDDGTHGDARAGDGVWSNSGGYTLQPSDDKGVWQIIFKGTTDDGAVIETVVRFINHGAAPGSHPRLYFSERDKPSLKARSANPKVAQLWQRIVAEAQTRRGPDPLSHGGRVFGMLDREYLLPSLLAYFDSMNRARLRMGANALVAYLTGDVSALNSAKSALLDVAAWDRWEPAWFTAQGQHTYYPAGQLAAEAALAYDLLYNELNESERSLVRRALINRSIIPTYKEYVLDNRVLANTSNWIGHTVGGALIAAAAISGDVTNNEDNGQLETCLNGLLLKMEGHLAASFLPDGSYGEGISYQEFDLETTLPAMTALENVFGIDYWRHSNVLGSLSYPIYTFVPSSSASPDMGDSHPPSGRTLAPLAARAKDPLARWFYNQFPHSAAIDFIFFNDTITGRSPAELKLPTSRVFRDKGNAVFRTGWEKDDWVFLFRAGANFNHNHADQGSFLLTAFGEALITESGWSHYYNDPYYATYFTQAVGHNTVLIDGNPISQSLPDTPQFAALDSFPRITDSVTSEFYDAVGSDLASVYHGKLSRYLRRIVFVKPHYFVIFDDLAMKEPARFDSLLHLPDRSRVTTAVDRALYTGDKAALAVRSFASEPINMTIGDGRLPYVTFATVTPKTVPPQPAILRLHPGSATREIQFVTVLVPGRRGEDVQQLASQMSQIAGPRFVGVKAQRGNERDLVVLRTGGGNDLVRVEDWATDAAAMTITSEGERVRLLALHDARSSRQGSREMFASDKPLSLAARYTTDAVEASISASSLTNVRLSIGSAWVRALLNGRELSPGANSSSDVLSLELPAGEHHLIIRLR